MLLDKLEELDSHPDSNSETDSVTEPAHRADWTATQIARNQLHAQLRLLKDELASGLNSDRRRIAIHEFHDYAYQWY